VGEAYSRAHVARICRVSQRRLRYWERTALVAASATRGEVRAFAFRDLVSVRSLRGLLEQGVSVRRIRRCLEAVRRRVPEIERPLESLRLWMEGSARVVVRHRGVLLEPDGQTVLDLGRAGGATVAALGARRRASAPGRGDADAFEWFERGCALDVDPAHYAEAARAYERAIALAPDFADAHCNLGAVRFNQDRREQARRCFERALEIDASHAESHLNLATLLEEESRLEEALRHYQAALRARDDCVDAHLGLALLYERLGARRRAREAWRRYLQLDPRGTWAALARRRLAPVTDAPRPDRSG